MARGVKVNMNSIIKKMKVSKGAIRQLEKKAKQDLKVAKKAYMDSFESHPITKELNAGIHASNTSGTLGGYGNLRTFMGFSSNPIPIYAFSNDEIMYPHSVIAFLRNEQFLVVSDGSCQ